MPRIQIIEDDRELIELLHRSLRKEGFEVVDDYNGNRFSAGEADAPDLYLVDIHLVGKNGIDLARIMKAEPHPKPVILMSANLPNATISAETGIDGFIGKPFQLDEMIRRIKQLLPSNTS